MDRLDRECPTLEIMIEISSRLQSKRNLGHRVNMIVDHNRVVAALGYAREVGAKDIVTGSWLCKPVGL